ncbi:MAG: hypothetical protein F6J97_20715 [Leptolyngbya sp. SIO4C1]|nr:hypothetical protein [Leptolyngbya sp. SIO4C1]
MTTTLSPHSRQLALPLNGDIRPQPLLRTPAQEQAFQTVLTNLRAETRQLLDAAVSLSGIPYASLTDVPTELLKAARESVFGASPCRLPAVSTESRPAKPYRAWSKHRKYGERCRRLMARVRKSTTFWYAEDLQEQVLQNPEYFGVCPLPSETACVYNPEQHLREQSKAAAIARENHYRLSAPG